MTGKNKGTAKLTINLKLNKEIAGSNKYKFKLKVRVKKKKPVSTAKPTNEPVTTSEPVPTPTPIIHASKISLSQSVSCVTGSVVVLSAQLAPNNSNDTVTWRSKNADIATVWGVENNDISKYADENGNVYDTNKAAAAIGSSVSMAVNGVAYAIVYGVSVGVTDIIASTNGITTTCSVTVDEKKVIPKLLDVNQKSADTVELVFDGDTGMATTPITKDQITVNRLNDSGVAEYTMKTNNIKTSNDGTVISLQISGNFQDKKKYQFVYENSIIEKVMSCGPVKGIALSTAMAEVNIATPVNYVLLDDQGIDVTAAHKLDSECHLTGEGDGILDNTRPSKTIILFDNVGDKADVTVSWQDPDNSGAKPVEATGTITCVEATTRKGTPRFKTGLLDGYKDWGDIENEYVTKFYTGIDDTVIQAKVDTTHDFWFCAVGDDNHVIKYDDYTVFPSNDELALAECEGHGRFVKITLSCLKQGSLSINVKGTFNGKDAFYTVPVTISPKPTLENISISSAADIMTNAMEKDYANELSLSLTGANNEPITLGKDYHAQWEVVHTPDGVGGFPANEEKIYLTYDKDSASLASFHALGLKAGQYTVKATVTSMLDDKQMSSQKTITVEDVYGLKFEKGDKCYQGKASIISGSVTYEFDSAQGKEFVEAGIAPDMDMEIHLNAFNKNKKFLGYVRGIDSLTIGTAACPGYPTADSTHFFKPTEETSIQHLETTVQHAGKYCKIDNDPETQTSTAYLFNLSQNGYSSTHDDTYGITPSISLKYTAHELPGTDTPNIPAVVEGKPEYDTYMAQSDATTIVRMKIYMAIINMQNGILLCLR